jgi:hypothetical protein
MLKTFSANEWRFPLLEIDFILLAQKNPKVKKGGSSIFKKQTISSLIFSICLFVAGSWIILSSSILINYRLWVFIVLFIILLWLSRGVYQVIIPMYSKKIRLLNYLYSPYIFAWRRDHLSEYTDRQIADAICVACGINNKDLFTSDLGLKEFLIALCHKTRPKFESKQYPEIIEKSISQANDLIWRE